jgi:hypothetical protein
MGGVIYSSMGDVCPVNSLVVARNLWLISLSKIGLFSNFVKSALKNFLNSKESKTVLVFTLA